MKNNLNPNSLKMTNAKFYEKPEKPTSIQRTKPILYPMNSILNGLMENNYPEKPTNNQKTNPAPYPVKNHLDARLSFEGKKSGLMNNYEKPPVLSYETPSYPVQNYAIIVPCYNEEKRFPFNRFLSFAKEHPEVLLCFVNDGSKDNTLAVLRGLQAENPKNICVYALARNCGKSEAVRQGMLFIHQNFSAELIGFLDADMATTPEEWLQMARYKEQFPQYGAIVGSRIQRLGATIRRNDNRSLMSRVVKQFIRVLLKTPFHDTQCGAKIFQRNLVPFLFARSFVTPWLFDVEIFLRLQKKFGTTTLQSGVLEFPLMHWTEVGGSKLKFSHSIKIPFQLLNLHYQYNIAKKINQPAFKLRPLAKQQLTGLTGSAI